MTDTINNSEWFACNTGDGMACTMWPYELIKADLAAVIGDNNAREACRVIGDHASRLSRHQMMSSLLTAFGEGLKRQATAQPLVEHPRRAPFTIKD